MAKSTTASSTLSKSTTSCDEDMHRDLAKPQASAPEVADEVETSSSPSQGQESNLTNSASPRCQPLPPAGSMSE